MNNFQERENVSKSKLWINVAPPSSISNLESKHTVVGGANHNPKTFVKPTVTTLLRQHSTLVRQEKNERSKVQGYTAGSLPSNQDQEAYRFKELEEQKHRQIDETKRILKARLAYHKAIAATAQKAFEKSVQAQQQRDQARKLAEAAESERMAQLARRRATAAEIQHVHTHSRSMVEYVQNQKRCQVVELKEQTKRLQDEVKRQEFEEFISKKERIQQIQSSKQALRAANANGNSNSTAGFIGVVGSPDAHKVQLTKESEKVSLDERRRRVATLKQEREQKLDNVRQRLERQRFRLGNARALETPFRAMQPFVHPTSDLADEEIVALMQELQTYQSQQRGGNLKLGG